MNGEFAIELGGQVVARLVDTDATAAVVGEMLLPWLRRGAKVAWCQLQAPQLPQLQAPAIAKQMGPSKWRAYDKTAAKAKKPAWEVGAGVYLRWDAIPEPRRAPFETVRNSKAKVVEIRTGQGIRKTVGIAFDGSADTHWLQPDELTTVLTLK